MRAPRELLVLLLAGLAWAGKDLVTIDLTKRGLPVTLEVPSCAKPSEPLIKLADNQRDVLLTCLGTAEHPELFSIQVGPAKGKIDRQAIAGASTFKRWVLDAKGVLQWENREGSPPRQDFVLRRQLGTVEYACFPQYATNDSVILAAELAACGSLRSAK